MIDTEELLNRLYKRAEERYYDDKPAYQFSKDELNLMHYLGWMDKASYNIKKQKLEQRIDEYYCLKQHYLLVI
jgi:hypothetical protein